MRRTIGIFITLLSLAATARAQPPATSFAELQGRLKTGQTVNVTDDAGETFTGKVDQVSDTMLVLRGNRHDLALPVLQVQRISRQVNRLRNGALIGLAVGFTTGAVMAATSGCEITCFASPGGIVIFGGFFGSIGMGIGASVGGSIHRERVIFERTTTGHKDVAVVPLVSRAGAGLRFQVDF